MSYNISAILREMLPRLVANQYQRLPSLLCLVAQPQMADVHALLCLFITVKLLNSKPLWESRFLEFVVSKDTILVSETPWPSQPFAAKTANVDRVHDEDVWPYSTPKKGHRSGSALQLNTRSWVWTGTGGDRLKPACLADLPVPPPSELPWSGDPDRQHLDCSGSLHFRARPGPVCDR